MLFPHNTFPSCWLFATRGFPEPEVGPLHSTAFISSPVVLSCHSNPRKLSALRKHAASLPVVREKCFHLLWALPLPAFSRKNQRAPKTANISCPKTSWEGRSRCPQMTSVTAPPARFPQGGYHAASTTFRWPSSIWGDILGSTTARARRGPGTSPAPLTHPCATDKESERLHLQQTTCQKSVKYWF